MSFAQQKKQEDESASGSGGSGDSNSGAARDSSASTSPAYNVNNSVEPSPVTNAAAEQSTSVEDDPGKLLNNGTTYVDASNWQAILDDVCLSLRISEPRLITCRNSSKKLRDMCKMMIKI